MAAPTSSLPPCPPSPQPSPPATPDGSGGAAGNRQAEEEHALLVVEIRRLESSMNGALRASRDEMEGLKDASAEKKAALQTMEGQLAAIRNQIDVREQRRSSGNRSVCSAKSGGSRMSHARRRPTSTSNASESTMRKSLMRQNSFLRRVSVSGDRPFFRRPALEDASGGGDGRERGSFRRNSDPAQPASLPPNLRRSSVNDDSLTSRNSSLESRGSNRQRTPGLRNSLTGSDGGLSSDSNESGLHDDLDFKKESKSNPEESDQELLKYQALLESKDNDLMQLRNQHLSNKNQLSFLQSKLLSIQNRTKSRREQHASTVKKLQNEKEVLSKRVDRRERLISEIERCLEQYEERITALEREIERKSRRGESVPNCDPNELRKCQLRLKLHSQYTSKAIKSFKNVLDSAKEKDRAGILFNRGEQNLQGDLREHNEEIRKQMIEAIAFDVDVQLSNLEKMIKDLGAKVGGYKLLLPSVELTTEESGSADDIDGATPSHGGGDSANDPPTHSNQLLILAQEYATLMEEFVSTLSKTMSSTIRTMPHSVSIEIPSPTSLRDNIPDITTCLSDSTPHVANHGNMSRIRDDSSFAPTSNHFLHLEAEHDELPYFQLHRKRLHLQELQRARLLVDSNISLIQNDIRTFQTVVEQEKQTQHDMMVFSQEKLQTMMGRLEDGGADIHGLVQELQKLTEREEQLEAQLKRQGDSESR
ncbi:hypothetical protein ACHAWF_012894 [Thalassiosira exigua]